MYADATARARSESSTVADSSTTTTARPAHRTHPAHAVHPSSARLLSECGVCGHVLLLSARLRQRLHRSTVGERRRNRLRLQLAATTTSTTVLTSQPTSRGGNMQQKKTTKRPATKRPATRKAAAKRKTYRTTTFFIRKGMYDDVVYFYRTTGDRIRDNAAYSACVDSLEIATGIPAAKWERIDTYTKAQTVTLHQ
jgi:hypothetical protein